MEFAMISAIILSLTKKKKKVVADMHNSVLVFSVLRVQVGKHTTGLFPQVVCVEFQVQSASIGV